MKDIIGGHPMGGIHPPSFYNRGAKSHQKGGVFCSQSQKRAGRAGGGPVGYPLGLETSSVRSRAARTGWTPGSQVGSITRSPQCTMAGTKDPFAGPFNSDRKLEVEGSSVASDSPHLAPIGLTQ